MQLQWNRKNRSRAWNSGLSFGVHEIPIAAQSTQKHRGSLLITDSPKSGVDHKSKSGAVSLECARRPLTEIISAPPRTGSEPNQGHPLVLVPHETRRGGTGRVFDKKSIPIIHAAKIFRFRILNACKYAG